VVFGGVALTALHRAEAILIKLYPSSVRDHKVATRSRRWS
jgi:hypothetical protein